MNTLKKLSKMIMVFSLGIMVMVSCGSGTDEIEPTPVEPIEPELPSGDEALTPIQQKEKLDEVAKDFLNQLSADNFSDLNNLCSYIARTYDDSYDWSNVKSWGMSAFEAVKTAIGTTTEKSPWNDNHTIVYSNYKTLLMAANFTGHFTAEGRQWVYAKANDLQFIFTDQAGKRCVVKMETSGNVQKVHLFDREYWIDSDYEYNEDTGVYKWRTYYDRNQYTIGLPEKIIISLTQNGKEMIRTTVNTKLADISGEEFDLSRSSISVSATVEFYNGYKLDISQVAYSANKSAAANCVLYKGETALLTLGASSDVSGLPSVNVSAFFPKNDNEDYDLDNANGKNAFVKLDILGKVQVQGKIIDIRKFAEYLDSANKNDTKERDFKSYVDLANLQMEIYMFYNNSNKTQAQVKLEPFEDEKWGGNYWIYEPVIYFFDRSSYSTFEVFFNKVITRFKDFIYDYSKMLPK